MSHFLHVLTGKGLNYVLRNAETPEIRVAVKNELRRRADKEDREELVSEREKDGYERDA